VVLLVLGIVGITTAQTEPAAEPQETPEAQHVAPPPQPHEQPTGDPHVTPIERRTSPPLPPAKLRRNGYQSVQVNVDEFGNNILGDAANEPSLAIDPTQPNRMVIGWRQFDTVTSSFRQAGYAYSHDGGATWTFPGVLDPGVFRSDPVLDADSDGNFIYNSLRAVGGYACDVFLSSDGGVTWSDPIFAYGGDKQWMAVDRSGGIGDGNVYAAWTRAYSSCNGNFTRSYDGGASFLDCLELPTAPQWGTLAVGNYGELYISSIGFAVIKSSTIQDSSLPPAYDFTVGVSLDGTVPSFGGPNPGGLLGQVWIAVDHSDGPTRDNVYMLCSVTRTSTSDPLDVMFARSEDGGETWSAPVRVNDDSYYEGALQWFGTMSVAPSGRIDAVWNDTRNTGSQRVSELYYAWSHDGGRTWSPNLVASPPFDSFVGWPQQNKLGDYYDMISDEGGVNLAYAATFNGEQDVYFVRLGDCNGNGVHDSFDIADQTSLDVNGNGVPDECEPDCNGNGIPDDWDIATGVSGDCNANGVPDDCDVADGTSVDANRDGLPDECAICAGAETAKVLAVDGAQGDQFGYALAADGAGGDRALVGASLKDGPATDTGVAYVLRPAGADWVEEVRLQATDADEKDYFGCAVSLWADVVVVGAYGDDGGGADHGAAYVFRLIGEDWVEQAKLVADDGSTGAKFGTAVAVAGDVAVVGAHGDDEAGTDAGAVYVFRWSGSAWLPEAKLTPPDAVAGDNFGYAVAAVGDVIVVGAYGDDEPGTDAGAAYVFRYDGGQWALATRLEAADVVANDRYGCSVAVADGPPLRVVVGAMRADEGGNAAGAAYVFVADGETWLEETKLLPVEIQAGALLGHAVTISAGPPWKVLAGAYADSVHGALSGAAYLFWNEGAGWFNVGRLDAVTDPFDSFGYAVAVVGDTALVGAYGDDDTASAGGAVYAFRGADDCDANAVPDLCDLAAGEADANHNGLLDVCEVLPGDLNCDGLVNNLDIRPFVQALVDPAGYVAAHPECLLVNADVNGDGVVSNFDIRPFVDLLDGK
jgi:hypothetical protein